MMEKLELTEQELQDMSSRTLSDAHAIREGANYVQDKSDIAPRLHFPNELIETIKRNSPEYRRKPYLKVHIDFETMDHNTSTIPEALTKLPDNLEFPEGISLIVGPNGSGKSTFLKTLQIALKGKDDISDLDYMKLGPELDFEKVLQVKSLAGKKTNVLMVDGSTDWKNKSGGFFDIISPYNKTSQRFAREKNWENITEKTASNEAKMLLLFDEPEMGVDPDRIVLVLSQVKSMVGKNSCIIIATNSEHLINSSYPRIDLKIPEKGLYFPDEN